MIRLDYRIAWYGYLRADLHIPIKRCAWWAARCYVDCDGYARQLYSTAIYIYIYIYRSIYQCSIFCCYGREHGIKEEYLKAVHTYIYMLALTACACVLHTHAILKGMCTAMQALGRKQAASRMSNGKRQQACCCSIAKQMHLSPASKPLFSMKSSPQAAESSHARVKLNLSCHVNTGCLALWHVLRG